MDAESFCDYFEVLVKSQYLAACEQQRLAA
jgi:hypothetical protein